MRNSINTSDMFYNDELIDNIIFKIKENNVFKNLSDDKIKLASLLVLCWYAKRDKEESLIASLNVGFASRGQTEGNCSSFNHEVEAIVNVIKGIK